MLDPLEIFSVEVPVSFFLEREAQAISIESRAFLRLSGDWAVTGNKYDFHACIIAETKMACSMKLPRKSIVFAHERADAHIVWCVKEPGSGVGGRV